MLKRYLLKDVGIDFGGDAVILCLANKCCLTMTHPSIAGRVTTDWNEDDVGGEGGAIVAKDGKTPKVFCNSLSVAHNLILSLFGGLHLSFILPLYHACVYFGWKKYTEL